MVGLSVTPGVWRHRLSGHRYLVIGVASDANNIDPRGELQVVYIALESDDQPTMHLRSLAEFCLRFEEQDVTGVPSDEKIVFNAQKTLDQAVSVTRANLGLDAKVAQAHPDHHLGGEDGKKWLNTPVRPFNASPGMFKVVGVDTFSNEDWVYAEWPTLEEAIECAEHHGGTMNKTHVYDDNGQHLFDAGSV